MSAAKIDCRHSLDTIAGYRIVRTVEDGQILDLPVFIARITGATSYGYAVELAQAFRRSGSWAVVDTQYLCGCWSTDRPELRASVGSR